MTTQRQQKDISAAEAEWSRRATAAAVRAARDAITKSIPMMTPVGRLNDQQIGWIVFSALCAWISKRAEQACSEGQEFHLDKVEKALQDPGGEVSPIPWDAGAVEHILPELGSIAGVDWSLPVGGWPKEMVIGFVCAAMELARKAFAARDVGGTIIKPAHGNRQDQARA
jgi:hypothetical protein